jgi:trehalose-6-phosphate synthase
VQDGAPAGADGEAEDKSKKGFKTNGSVDGRLSAMSGVGGVVIVAAVLPVKVTKTSDGAYDIVWDSHRAVSKLRNPKRKFKYVGWVGLQVPEGDQQALRDRLVRDFNCFPIFLDHGIAYRVFDIFCQSVLSQLFHHIIELAEEGSDACWNWDHWHEYEKVNKSFSDLALTTTGQGGPYAAGDRLWVLDYEMMLVPHYASRKNPNAPIGYSFLSVFPSTEVFRVLPVRIEVRVLLLALCA